MIDGVTKRFIAFYNFIRPHTSLTMGKGGDKKINNLRNEAKIEKNIINCLFCQTAVWVDELIHVVNLFYWQALSYIFNIRRGESRIAKRKALSI